MKSTHPKQDQLVLILGLIFIIIIKSIVYSFSLAAALLLPINIIIEVKDLPTHRDSATLHSGVTELHYLLVIPFVRV